MELGWSLWFRDAIFTRGGEEFVWVDRVILKKIIFLMIVLDGFQQVNYP